MSDPWANLDRQRSGGGPVTSSPPVQQAGVLGGSPPTSAGSDPWSSLDQRRAAGGPLPQASQAGVAGAGGGGSGIGGFLSKVGHGLAHQAGEAVHIVAGVPTGLARFGQDVLHSAEHQINTHDIAGTLKNAVWENPRFVARAQPGEDTRAALTRSFPAFGAQAAGIRQTGNEIAHPTQAVANYKADPLGSFLNDALTVSLVAGPTAGALGRGAAVADSAGLARAAGVAGKVGKVAGHVAAAPLLPLKGLSMLPTAIGDAGFKASMAAEAAGERAPLAARLTQPLSPAFRDMARTLREGESMKQGALAGVSRTAAAAGKAAPDAVLQQVAMGMAEGEAPALAHLRDAAPAKFDQFIAERYKGTLSTEAAHHLADIGSGGGDPTVVAQANAYLDRINQGMGSRGVGGLSGLNEKYLTAHPEQGGFDPLTHDPTAGPNELTSAPSRLRPMLATNRAVSSALGEHGLLPETLADVAAKGQDAQYMPHMREGRPASGISQSRDTALPRLRTITSEKLRGGSPIYDRSIKGVARGMAEQTGKAADLRTAQAVTDLPHVVRLNEGPLAGVQSIAEARRAGYVPWDPKALFDTGTFRPLTDEQLAKGDTSALHFIPKPMFDRFRTYFERKAPGPAGEAFDKTTRAFYKTTLHGTPYFAKMYALQNLGLAATRGDVSIGDMIRLAPKAIQALKSGEFPELQGRLPIGDEAAAAPGPKTMLRKAGRAVSGGLPRVIDGFSRTLVALDKIGKGASPEEAILEANRTMGMYNAESGAAQAMIRRVFPIYPWARHVLTAMGEFAGDHPLKAMFLLHLGQVAATDDTLRGTPEFQRGLLPLGGGKALDIRDLNPLSIFSSAPTAFTNPLLRAAAGAGAGVKVSNLGTGKPIELSRPPTVNQHGPLSAAEAAHFVQGQTPLGHAFQSLTEKPVLRYDTGEPKFSRGKPIPKQPTQPYWQHLLGNPVIPQATTSPALQRKLTTIDQSKAKTARKYLRNRQRSGL